MVKPLSLTLAVLLLAGFTVGPNYVRPESELPAAFDQATAEAAQQRWRPASGMRSAMPSSTH